MAGAGGLDCSADRITHLKAVVVWIKILHVLLFFNLEFDPWNPRVTGKAFYADILEDQKFIRQRRKLLRQRKGLKDTDSTAAYQHNCFFEPAALTLSNKKLTSV